MGKRKPRTQEDIILDHMKNYRCITSMQAFELYHITRLSGRIHDLRREGYKIVTELHWDKDHGTNFAVYKYLG